MTQQRVIFTTEFWIAAAERAAKTAGQSAALAVAPIALSSLDTVGEYLLAMGYAMFGGALLSVLTSLGSAEIGNAGPSLTNEVLVDAVKDDVYDDFDPDSTSLPEGGYASDSDVLPEG